MSDISIPKLVIDNTPEAADSVLNGTLDDATDSGLDTDGLLDAITVATIIIVHKEPIDTTELRLSEDGTQADDIESKINDLAMFNL